MNRSLYSKLVLIILFLIIALMLVTGVFLTRGVRSFYLNDFYENMAEAFADNELAVALREAAAEDDVEQMSEILGVYNGSLGIDRGTRNYYILSGEGEFNDNGAVTTVKAGDVTWTPDGEGHSLKATSDKLEFIALVIYSA